MRTRCLKSWWKILSLTLMMKDTRRVVKPWTRDALPPYGNAWVWKRRRAQKWPLQRYCDRRMGYQPTEDGFGGQILIFRSIGVWIPSSDVFPLILNPADAMMISSLISFEDLQNTNVCLRPGKMNGYAEDPGQTSLLKISKKIVKPIGPDQTLIT